MAISAEGNGEIRQLSGRNGPIQQGVTKIAEGQGHSTLAGEEAVDFHEGQAGGQGIPLEDAGVIGREAVGVPQDAGPAARVERIRG